MFGPAERAATNVFNTVLAVENSATGCKVYGMKPVCIFGLEQLEINSSLPGVGVAAVVFVSA